MPGQTCCPYSPSEPQNHCCGPCWEDALGARGDHESQELKQLAAGGFDELAGST